MLGKFITTTEEIIDKTEDKRENKNVKKKKNATIPKQSQNTCTGILHNPWANPPPTWKAKTSNTQCILSMLWPAYKKKGLTCSVLRPFLKKTTNTNSLQTLSSFRERPATWSAAASMALLPAQTELSYGRPPGAWLFTCFGRSTLIGSDPLTTSCWDNRVGLLC